MAVNTIIHTLLSAVATSGAGAAVKMDPIAEDRGPFGLLIWSAQPATAFVATVTLQATIATEQEVRDSTATWVAVASKSWTADAADTFEGFWTHIRLNVTGYTSGSINARLLR